MTWFITHLTWNISFQITTESLKKSKKYFCDYRKAARRQKEYKFFPLPLADGGMEKLETKQRNVKLSGSDLTSHSRVKKKPQALLKETKSLLKFFLI